MITVSALHKSLAGKPVLQGVDLVIERGESCVIIGGSGAGKSVLIKCMLGLMTADRGTIQVDGRRPGPALMDRIGMLFQGAALFDSLPIWQNVSFRHLRGSQRQKARTIAVETLAKVGLDADVADRYPAELSGGMQKRVGLARAIAADPKIIFFDEPTTGLDPIMAGVINKLIRDVVTDLGVTAVTITHDMTTVYAVADRIAMLHGGVIRWNGLTADLATADDPYLCQFVSGNSSGPMAPQGVL